MPGQLGKGRLATMNDVASAMGLTWPAIEDRLKVLGLTGSDRERLAGIGPAARSQADRFIEHLYARLTRSPGTRGWFTRPETIERLATQQREYLSELFTAPIDWNYVQRRLAIGVAHHRVRLTPRWYVATCAHFITGHIDLLFSASPTREEAIDRLVTLTKTILFDASLVLDAYGMSLEQAMRTGELDPRFVGSSAEESPDATSTESANHTPAPSMLTRLRLTSDDCEERRQFLDIDAETRAALAELEPSVRAALPALLEDFYTIFRRWPATAGLLDEPTVDRLVRQVQSYWIELMRAPFDRLYAASRTRIGVVHEQLGVPSQVYLAGLARQLGGLLRAVTRSHAQPVMAASCLVRSVFFDVSFILDAYIDARAATVLRTEGYASQILSCLTVGVAVLDASLRVRSANPTLLQLLGVDAGVVCRMRASDLVPDPRLPALIDRAATAKSRREFIDFEFGGRRLRVTAAHLEGGTEDSGQPPLALLINDLTDLSAVAPDLEETQWRFSETVAAVDAVLWEAEPKTWIMSLVSAPVLSLTGLREVHFLGRPGAWLDRIPEPDRHRLAEVCDALPLGGRGSVIHRLTHADGSTRWVRTNVVRTGVRLETSAFRGVSIDVSGSLLEERRRLEAVGRLAGSIAHEFNGLLSVISANLGLLEESTAGSSPAEIRAGHEAVERGARLTRRLQAFARGVPQRPRPVVLNQILHALETGLQRTAGAHVAVDIRTESDLWPCQIDTGEFESALLNLVSNSRESMPAGGSLRIGTRNIHAHDLVPSPDIEAFVDHVEVAVTDTGTGMEPETRVRAVEPFFTTKPAAAGLGLSVVHGFVHQSHGHLLIESDPTRGTTVRLRFPRLPAADGLPPSPTPDGTEARRVLILDDDVSLASTLQRFLTRRGHVVRVAHSIAAARKLLAHETPDLVLCDVILDGEVEGPTLGRELRVTSPSVALVYMSGYTRDSLRLGDEDFFLAKPFSIADLEAAMRKALVAR